MKTHSEKPEFVPFGPNRFGDIVAFRKWTSAKPYKFPYIDPRIRIYPFKAIPGFDVSVPYTLDYVIYVSDDMKTQRHAGSAPRGTDYVIDVSDDLETACREFVLMCESEGKIPVRIRRTESWS